MATKVDIDNFVKSLEQDYQPRAQAAIVRAVERFCEFIIGEAQERCPVKTGALKASAVVEDAVQELDNVFCQFGFNTNYAAAVHEIITNKHSQGQAKFLETAMTDHAPKLLDYVMQELQKEFGS